MGLSKLYKWRRDVVEHSWDPRRVSPRWPSCCLPQQLQQPAGSALDSKPGRGRTSFTPTQRARSEMKQWRGWENRKAAFNLMDLCPEYTYKNHSRFSFSRRSFLEGVWLVTSPCAIRWAWQSAPGHVWRGAGNLIHTQKNPRASPALGPDLCSRVHKQTDEWNKRWKKRNLLKGATEL